jgi:hypothetical protein
MFISSVNNTGDKLFGRVNDTADKFMTPVINLCNGFSLIAGINDTGEHWLPVTMTPVINFSLVSTTPVNNYWR